MECKFLIPLNIRRFCPTMKRQRQIGCRELLNSANYNEFRIYITKFTYKNADRVTYFSIFLQFLLQCRVIILIALLLYWIVAIYNCHRMTIKMDSTNLLLRDSPLNNVAWIYERYLWREGSLVNFSFFFCSLYYAFLFLPTGLWSILPMRKYTVKLERLNSNSFEVHLRLLRLYWWWRFLAMILHWSIRWLVLESWERSVKLSAHLTNDDLTFETIWTLSRVFWYKIFASIIRNYFRFTFS